MRLRHSLMLGPFGASSIFASRQAKETAGLSIPSRRRPPSPHLEPVLGATVKFVVDTLSTRIASQEYTPDERLPAERQLAQELGVARNTVRDALDVLEGRCLIQRRPGSGTFVSSAPSLEAESTAPVASETGPLHLLAVRGILEPEMIRLAIITMPPRQIEKLSHILSEMEKVRTDVAVFLRLEEDFNRTIAEGTGNPLLVACYNLVIDVRRQAFRAALYRRTLTPKQIQFYQQAYNSLFNAIVARDTEQAAEFMKLALIEDQKLLAQ